MEQFTQQLTELLKEILGEKYEISQTEVTKINDCKHPTLVIREKDSNIGANIYLDDYYEAYERGNLHNIAESIVKGLQQERKPNVDDNFAQELMNFDSIKKKIFFKLINKDMNKDYLKNKCYIDFLDMAVVFYIFLEKRDSCMASTSISPEMMKHWNCDANDLFTIAKENMSSGMPAEIVSLEKIILQMLGIEQDDEFSKMMTPPTAKYILYVLSNTNSINGAATILYDDVMKSFAEEHEVERVIILPSSLHEVLLVPIENGEEIDGEFLKEMVRDANTTAVRRGDMLSYNIYLYDLKQDKISIWE